MIGLLINWLGSISTLALLATFAATACGTLGSLSLLAALSDWRKAKGEKELESLDSLLSMSVSLLIITLWLMPYVSANALQAIVGLVFLIAFALLLRVVFLRVKLLFYELKKKNR